MHAIHFGLMPATVAVIRNRHLQRNPAGHQHVLGMPAAFSLSQDGHASSCSALGEHAPHALHLGSMQNLISGLCRGAGPVMSRKASQSGTAKILDQARARDLEIILAHFRKDALISRGPEHLVQAMCSSGTTLTSAHLDLIQKVRGLAFQT